MRAKLLSLFALSILLAGCAGYHLGPVNGQTAGNKTVEVQPFNNQTLQPRLGDAVTQALRERFQSDGTYRLATSERGDIVVSGIITRYTRLPLSYLNRDVSTPENYRIDIVAHVTATDRTSGKILLSRDVSGKTLVNVGSDLQSAERQAAPLLAENLARNIAEMVTEGAW